VKQRLPWLVVNLFTASLSAMVISQFETTIADAGGAGGADADRRLDRGDAGTQSLAVAVRALATRDLTRPTPPAWCGAS
jgi:magnesium transporter